MKTLSYLSKQKISYEKFFKMFSRMAEIQKNDGE